MPCNCNTPGCDKMCAWCKDLPFCSEEKHCCESVECNYIQSLGEKKIEAVFGFCPWCKMPWGKCNVKRHTNIFYAMHNNGRISILNPPTIIRKIPYIEYSGPIVAPNQNGFGSLYYQTYTIKYRRVAVPF
jgi:hypothetical protein